MGKWIRGMKKAIRAGESIRKIREHFLLVEALEPRVLLSGDPIYSYADPDGVASWYNSVAIEPNWNPIRIDYGDAAEQINQQFHGNNFLSGQRIKVLLELAREAAYDFRPFANQFSELQYLEWGEAALQIPYYTYNSGFVEDYYNDAVTEHIVSWAYATSSFEDIEPYLSLYPDLENWQSRASSLLPHFLPDIQVATLNAPDKSVEGSIIQVSSEIFNDSDHDTLSFTSQYFLMDMADQDIIINLDDPVETINLPGGESIELSESVELPVGVYGDFYLGFYSNVGTVVPEDNTSNNLMFIPLTIAPAPDFTALDVWATSEGSSGSIASARMGDIVQFHVSVERPDDVLMPEASINVYASLDMVFDNSDTLLDVLFAQQLFVDDEQAEATLSFDAEILDEIGIGSYHLIAIVDSEDVLVEPNEDDNIVVSSLPFVVTDEIIPPGPPGIPVLLAGNGLPDNDNLINDSTPAFNWPQSIDNNNGSGIGGYQWRVNDDEWSNSQTGLSATTNTLGDDSHIFYVRAIDNSGNIGPESSVEFTIDTNHPVIASVLPTGKQAEGFDFIDITFAEPINHLSLGTSDVTLTGPNGLIVITDTEELNNSAYRFHLPLQTIGGSYTFVIGPDITDIAGNALLESHNGEIILLIKAAIGDGQVRQVSFYDADNSLVTVKLAKGEAEIIFVGDNLKKVIDNKGLFIQGRDVHIENIEIVTGGSRAKLTITAKGGDNKADLGGITGNSLGSLNAKAVALTGNIDLDGGLAKVYLNAIADNVSVNTSTPVFKNFVKQDMTLKTNVIGANVVFDLAGSVKSFKANGFASGILQADSFGKIAIKYGMFGTDVIARSGDIKSLTASGNITGQLIADNNIGKVRSKSGDITGVVRAGNDIVSVQAYSLDHALLSAGRNIKKVNMKGHIIDSHILAGYDVGVDGAFSSNDLLGSGNVEKVSAKAWFRRSYIGAGVLPVSPMTNAVLPSVGVPAVGLSGNIGKVKFGRIDFNADTDFGLYAATSIQPIKVGKAAISLSIANFDFEVL